MSQSLNSTPKKPTSPKLKIILPILALSLLVLVLPTSILIMQHNSSHHSNPAHYSTHYETNLVQYVNPFIGTAIAPSDRHLGSGFAGGNVFPGASYPHGMVQWSPDTTSAAGGYRYAQSLISGFSLTHFSGRGCSSYQDFPFLPTIGPLHLSSFSASTYSAHYSHSNETATPGYYSVRLDSTNIQVALTVTPRTGFGRFTYPRSKNAIMLINASGSATGNADNGTGIQIIGNNEVTGSATSGHFCGRANTYTIYFAAIFNIPFKTFGTWNGSTITLNSHTSNGGKSGAYLNFDTTQNPTILVKVSISFVSIANARLNLANENPDWNFDAIRTQASTVWNEKLHEIEVAGGTTEEKTIFYTALYHTLFHPNIFSDVNGQYRGFDGKAHTARNYIQYENFPGWDMYRSLIGLRALLEPKETSDMIQSLVADAQQGGGALPRWEVANDNSAGMVGDSIDIVIATSYAFGVRNFDTSTALQAMDAGASNPQARSGKYHPREGLSDYLKLGYVSTSTYGSAAITLEYTTDDFAIAQFARSLGNMNLYHTYMTHAQNWKHLFNTATGYIEPRSAKGSFIPNFNPMSGNGFVEGDGAQYTWMVPYDPQDLFAKMGGNAEVVSRLNQHFTQLNGGPNSPYAFMGNEPEFEVPWEYDFAGAPYRTQDVVRRIEARLFHAAPDGLPGNDDGGAMSSWYIFSALGLYPEIPGVAGFALGSPLFPEITVHLGNGHLLHISAQNASPDAPYIQSLKLNDQLYTNPWIPFDIIKSGATLQYTLGTRPNTNWGKQIVLTFTSHS